MATYSVVCSAVGGFDYANRFTLYVELTNKNGNSATNKSDIEYKVYFQNTSGGGTFTSNTRLYFRLNGVVIKDTTSSVTGPRNGTVEIASGTMTGIDHNPDGTQAVTFQALVQSSSYGISGNIENTFGLTTIPRYSEINSFSIQNIGVNTVTLQYSVSRTANIYCSVDGMAWGNPQVYNTTSGTFTIGGLAPGVNHSFAILVRAVDSGLDRISGNLFATTKDIARIQTANNFNIGETPSMTYTPAPAGCWTKAYLERITGNGGNRIDDISTAREVTGTSCTFDYDVDWLYSQLSQGNSAWCRYCLVTVCNGTEYLHYVDRQYFVTNSNPIFSNFEYQDVNEDIVNNLTGNNKTIIKGFSNVQATIPVAHKATAVNGALMKEYRLSIGEKSEKQSYSETEDVSIIINSVLSNKFTVYAVDSRGNSTSKEMLADNYIEYQNIAIKTMTATRKNTVQSETTLTFNGTIWNGNFGLVDNEITECYYRFRNVTQQEWIDGTSEIVPTKDGIDFSFSAVIVGDLGAEGFDIDESFEIQVFIADKLSNNYSNPSSFILGPGTPAIAIYKNNVAIGGRYNTEQSEIKLQINGKARANNLPEATALAIETYDDVGEGQILQRSGLYSTMRTETQVWYHLINLRHRNGNGDGVHYGLQLRNPMLTTRGKMTIRQQYAGDWGEWRTIQEEPVVLYENLSGTTVAVPLSEASENFRWLEVQYMDYDGMYGAARAFSNTSCFLTSYFYLGHVVTSYLKGNVIYPTGNTINRTVAWETAIKADGATLGTESIDTDYTKFKIIRVLGYR